MNLSMTEDQLMSLFEVTRREILYFKAEAVLYKIADIVSTLKRKINLNTLRRDLRGLRKSLSYWQHMHITEEKGNIWLIEWQILSILPEIERLEKRIGYLRKMAQIEKDKKAGKPVEEIASFDIEGLKTANILEIARSFGLVPELSGHKRAFIKLRNERTPSCCLYLDRNSWYDFGSGEHGDVIDLVGKLDNCDFKNACKRLIYMGY